MDTKILPAEVKAATADGDLGTFEAIVSVFGNIDSYGDIVMPGAFANTLKEWAASGDLIPVLWSHQSSDLFAHVGVVLEAKETPEGLWVKCQLDIDTKEGAQVFRLLKGRRLKQFSFGYKLRSATRAERDGQPVLELNDLELIEVSPTLVGANPDTVLLGVKSDVEVKAGRAISAANEALLRAAQEAIGALLAAVAPAEADPAKAQPGPAVKAEEPEPANAEELPAQEPAHDAASADAAATSAAIKALESTLSIIETEGLIK